MQTSMLDSPRNARRVYCAGSMYLRLAQGLVSSTVMIRTLY